MEQINANQKAQGQSYMVDMAIHTNLIPAIYGK